MTERAFSFRADFPSRHFAIFAFALAGVVAFTSGCSTIKPPEQTGFGGNTAVTVLLSSTANDQVTLFDIGLQTLTLTSRTGKSVTLLSSDQPVEFMHLNGGIEPLTTIAIPQGVYTSAQATISGGLLVCIGQVLPGAGLGIPNYSIVNQGPTVSLSSPITVTGSSMGLMLNMQVSSSAILPSSCWTTPAFEGFSMAPTFSLTALSASTSPATSATGKVDGLMATVAAVGTTSSNFTLTIAAGPFGTRTLSASSSKSTVFQGVSGAADISPGMFVDVDGVVQSDGSLLAARVEVKDSSAVNDSAGPVIWVDSVTPALQLYGRNELGPLQTFNGRSGIYLSTPYFGLNGPAFKISGQFTNLQNLPFVPSFNASNIVAGQNVDITSGNFSLTGGIPTLANTITLVPQTIDATVVSSQQIGSFVDYTVSLASYDLFPTLAVQQGQTTVLNDPSQVEVYIDSNTQKLNTQSLTPGGTLRFYGLVFNDNGTLRMDCAQVSDGVSLTPQPASSVRSTAAEVKAVVSGHGHVVRSVTTMN